MYPLAGIALPFNVRVPIEQEKAEGAQVEGWPKAKILIPRQMRANEAQFAPKRATRTLQVVKEKNGFKAKRGGDGKAKKAGRN